MLDWVHSKRKAPCTRQNTGQDTKRKLRYTRIDTFAKCSVLYVAISAATTDFFTYCLPILFAFLNRDTLVGNTIPFFLSSAKIILTMDAFCPWVRKTAMRCCKQADMEQASLRCHASRLFRSLRSHLIRFSLADSHQLTRRPFFLARVPFYTHE